MLVSVAIFTVVMVIALGSMLTLSNADRKAESAKSIINNLNFALDNISRSIRTGNNYQCITNTSTQLPIVGTPTPTDCTGGAQAIGFVDSAGRTVVYCLGSGTTCNSSTGTAILRSTDAGNSFLPITSAEVIIAAPTSFSYTPFVIYVKGAPPQSSADNIQPKVTILIHGYVQTSAGNQTSFDLQTSIAQRIYDL